MAGAAEISIFVLFLADKKIIWPKIAPNKNNGLCKHQSCFSKMILYSITVMGKSFYSWLQRSYIVFPRKQGDYYGLLKLILDYSKLMSKNFVLEASTKPATEKKSIQCHIPVPRNFTFIETRFHPIHQIL